MSCRACWTTVLCSMLGQISIAVWRHDYMLWMSEGASILLFSSTFGRLLSAEALEYINSLETYRSYLYQCLLYQCAQTRLLYIWETTRQLICGVKCVRTGIRIYRSSSCCCPDSNELTGVQSIKPTVHVALEGSRTIFGSMKRKLLPISMALAPILCAIKWQGQIIRGLASLLLSLSPHQQCLFGAQQKVKHMGRPTTKERLRENEKESERTSEKEVYRA